MRCFIPPFKGNEAAHQCPRADSRFLVEGFPSLILTGHHETNRFGSNSKTPGCNAGVVFVMFGWWSAPA